MRRFLTAFIFILCLTKSAFAHTSSESFLSLAVDQQIVSGTWAIALRDLEYELNIDQNLDGKITWAELLDKQKEIERLSLSSISLSVSDQSCILSVQDLLVDKKSDGTYASLVIKGECLKPFSELATLNLKYDLFFEKNPQHRGLLQVNFVANDPRVFVFSPKNKNFLISGKNGSSSFRQFFVEGVWHIWTGYDHILFLLALLFPAVLVKKDRSWYPVEDFMSVFIPVLKVVTAFTVAHSITLALAALDIITLPSRLVELVIAFSVLLAAINNIFSFVKEHRLWCLAFVFGLIHGFGFASIMSEFGLGEQLLLTTVVTFNLGVEAGQLVIVLLFLPVAFFLRRSNFYRWIILWGGSFAISLLALQWMIDRY